MTSGEAAEPTQDSLEELVAESAPRLTDNRRAFTVMVRNAMFRRVELFADEQEQKLGELDADSGWDADRWADALDEYFDEYDDIFTDASARSPRLLTIDEHDDTTWRLRQTFSDPDDNFDFGITATVDLLSSDDVGAPVIRIDHVGSFRDAVRS